MIYTPLTPKLRPLHAIRCPICDQFLGAMYRDGLSIKAYAKPCTPRCVRLWRFARGRSGWRGLDESIRQPDLAARLLENETRQ